MIPEEGGTLLPACEQRVNVKGTDFPSRLGARV
jgi:hypothetical protein